MRPESSLYSPEFESPKTRTASLLTTFVLTFVVVLILGVLAGTGPASARETGARQVGEPGVAAQAWALIDLRSGEYLAGEDPTRPRPEPGSAESS